MDKCNNIIRNVHAISSTDNLDDLLKAVTYADLEAMKGEILNEVQSKLEMFRESLGIEKSRAKKNSKLGQLNMNHDSYSAEKPFELNLESDTTTNETHLDVVVDSSKQTDLKEKERVDPVRQRMDKLFSIRTKYSKSFTMHGVSYILHGSWRERFSWLSLLVVSLVCVYLLTGSMFIEFMEDKINERRYKEKVVNLTLPTFTVCPAIDKPQFLPVDLNETRVINYAEAGECFVSKNCLNSSSINIFPMLLAGNEYHLQLTNDTIGRLGGYCFTFNPNGTLAQSKENTYRKAVMILSHEFKYFHLYINSPGYNYSLNPAAILSIGTTNHIILKKEEVKRIPQHKNPCIGINEAPPNIFKANYSQSSCFLECRLKQMYEECKLIPARYHSFFKYKAMNNTSAANSCSVHSWGKYVQTEKCTRYCGEACASENYPIKMQSTPLDENQKDVLHIIFEFKELYVERVEEYHAYTFATFFSNLGGTIGLMTGMSVLSLCEFIFCICCMVGEVVLNIKLKMKGRRNSNSNQS